MNEMLELIRRAKADGKPHLLTAAIPYARFLGITVDDSTGELLGKLRFSDMLIGNVSLPALHGGTMGALLESTAIFHLLWEAETVRIPKTINITVEYLRSARAMDTYARGIITRHGRRVANVRAEAWQEEPNRPVASAHAHFLLTPAEENPAGR